MEQVTIETITADVARTYLGRNTMNRPIDKQKVAYYKMQMEEGRWKLGESAIVFAEDGTLLNGQHRLLALAEYGKPLQFIVVRNIDKETFSIMDTGKKRTSGDVLAIYGVPSARNISATIKKEISLIGKKTTIDAAGPRGNSHNYSMISNDDILAIYKTNEDLYQEIYKTASRISAKSGRLLRESDLAGIASYLIIDLSKPFDKVFDFFSQVVSLTNAEKTPCELLRQRLLKDKTEDRSKIPPFVKQKLIIKAWNYYQKGFDAKILKYVREEDDDIWFE